MSDNTESSCSDKTIDGCNESPQEQGHCHTAENLAHWQELVSQRDQIIHDYGQSIVQLAVGWTEHDRQLQRANHDRDKLATALDEIKNSTSWKLTKPLRALTGLFGRRKSSGLQNAGVERGNGSSHDSCDYQEDIDFTGCSSNLKPIAFYLPQFHAIPENDKWWGEGFTEWTNTSKAQPRFEGHYQPREPHDDFGYYNLTDLDTIKKQVELAKRHGVYGFCYYLYWFSGKRLLERPLDILMDHPEIDIKFCLCWANENWTRNWDGLANEILIEQPYRLDDPARLIDDIKKYLDDERYIKVDGKPVVLIYNRGRIPNLVDFLLAMRERANNNGIGEIQIWMCRSFGMEGGIYKPIIDAEVEFPPHNTVLAENVITSGNQKVGITHSYPDMVDRKIDDLQRNWPPQVVPCYFTVMMSWDNTARKQGGWVVYDRFSLYDYYRWVRNTVEHAERNQQEFFFINAWNEWAEGTYLEPDRRYGYAAINTLSRALYKLPFSG